MYRTNEQIIKHKVELPNLAEELGNVSKTCQVMVLSHDTFYRYKQAVKYAINAPSDGKPESVTNKEYKEFLYHHVVFAAYGSGMN